MNRGSILQHGHSEPIAHFRCSQKTLEFKNNCINIVDKPRDVMRIQINHHDFSQNRNSTLAAAAAVDQISEAGSEEIDEFEALASEEVRAVSNAHFWKGAREILRS